jgi:hypothetical protein
VTFPEILAWVLRGFGAMYFIGGVWMARQMWFWARMSPDMDRMVSIIEHWGAERSDEEHDAAEDHGRSWWLWAGGVITAICGVSMLLAHRFTPLLLALLIVHQLLYFIRQRRREVRALTPEDAQDARPNQQTVNGFFSAVFMALLAAWLGARGALWG